MRDQTIQILIFKLLYVRDSFTMENLDDLTIALRRREQK